MHVQTAISLFVSYCLLCLIPLSVLPLCGSILLFGFVFLERRSWMRKIILLQSVTMISIMIAHDREWHGLVQLARGLMLVLMAIVFMEDNVYAGIAMIMLIPEIKIFFLGGIETF